MSSCPASGYTHNGTLKLKVSLCRVVVPRGMRMIVLYFRRSLVSRYRALGYAHNVVLFLRVTCVALSCLGVCA